MGELFRSEEMQLVQLFVQFEAAHDTVDELGKLGEIQFIDLNKDQTTFQRNFVTEVKRCDEMERKLRFLDSQLEKHKDLLEGEITIDSPVNISMDALEAKLFEEETELLELNTNQEMLYKNRNELLELKQVLEKDAQFFDEEGDEGDSAAAARVDSPLLLEEDIPSATTSTNLGFITGVLVREKFGSFERVLWRALRGNLFMKHAEITEPMEDPHTGEELEKLVFIIFYQGERAQVKIRKICEAFKANIYPCPSAAAERRKLSAQVETRLKDLDTVLQRGLEHRQRVLRRISRDITGWKQKVSREKAIYHTMNMFNYDVGRKCLIAEGWCPTNSTNSIQQALRRATEKSGALVPSILSVVKATEEPPTFFRNTEFTQTFQDIVDAYGVPRYGEANPMPFSIITFPFLFAVMYGDVGHGFLMVLVALALIGMKKSFQKGGGELSGMIFAGRYLLLLMGIFSIYTGFMYNECFSVPMRIFKSGWDQVIMYNPDGTVANIDYVQNGVYPFGVDWVWLSESGNALQFYNSVKMKMSIIYGVSQMMLGIFMHAFNAAYFKKKYDFFFEFIPQALFLGCLFGYMVFLIFYKWGIDWNAGLPNRGPADAPQILTTMINIFLKPFSGSEKNPPEFPAMFPGQFTVQRVLAIIAIAMVPIMLFFKPCCMRCDHKRGYVAVGHGHGHGEEFDFTEIFVHQIIHTIEFVLGAVSNTASYLRLWALSLAHAELSEVFWEKALVLTMELNNPAGVFVGFAVWAGFTVGVLLVMEALSAFLHALRLHWVEFQNKFFDGDGKPFEPFSYKRLSEVQE